ncbi:MAG: CoA ester lyase [Gemmatimonadota bacterium]|nr:CoA ester lyase [Gemmatimonadota bacterium]
MRLIRSWMFVPGDRQRMIDKAMALNPDAVIFDIEDSVTPENKSKARGLISEALGRPKGGPARFVRLNGLDSVWTKKDLEAVVRAGLAGLMIPKVHSVDNLTEFEGRLSKYESDAGLPAGSVRLVAVIESARGLVNAAAIADSSPRLAALMFGAEDFALDLGIISSQVRDAGDMLYARSAAAVAAASAKLQAIDRIVKDITDQECLQRDTFKAVELGFTGKAVIHPDQIETVRQAFTPSEEEVVWARRVISAYDEASARGDGAIAMDGRLIDWPIVKQARRIMEVADNSWHQT